MESAATVKPSECLKTFPGVWNAITAELHKRIVGQDRLIEQLLTSLFARGHCLIIGVPGLAKTLLIQTLGEIADLHFSRIQFTPDMMPSDITGSEILDDDPATGRREFRFVRGPVFGQLILADEINRTPPKTQAALLEAMQEKKVTVAGKRYDLQEPFFVLATQNPIEQEGTYPLPEAQLDRFMFCLNVDYPTMDEEVEILLSTTMDEVQTPTKVLNARNFLELQTAIRRIPVPQSVARFIARLVRATRPTGPEASPLMKQYVRWGAGPRACQYLALAGKVHAALEGRFNVAVEDIHRMACPVLRHRVILNYRAEADARTADDLIAELLRDLPA